MINNILTSVTVCVFSTLEHTVQPQACLDFYSSLCKLSLHDMLHFMSVSLCRLSVLVSLLVYYFDGPLYGEESVRI